MATIRGNIALVSCLLLVIILLEGAKPAYGKKAKKLKKTVAKLEQTVNEIKDNLTCKRK